jgi:glucose/arabinose dehydrogenase
MGDSLARRCPAVRNALRGLRAAAALAPGVFIGCTGDAGDASTTEDELALQPECGAAPGERPALVLTPIVSGLDLPTYVAAAPGDAERLFILEQRGAVRVARGGTLDATPWADLSDRVFTTLPAYSEYGLLGLAFHPSFASNGRVFIHYSSIAVPEANVGEGAGVISEFALDPAGALDPSSERRLLVVEQPEGNHNGGMLAFGPADGLLYIGLGDGGGQGDPRSNGQNLGTWLGKMLRIDVDTAPAGAEYGIPAGNMTGEGVLPEIWSYGLRNPWRFSFDACTADLYIGDVGQNLFEEIDLEPPNAGGRNYGWSVLESSSCFNDAPDEPPGPRPSFTAPLDSCSSGGLTPPIAEYNRLWGCSLTGGYAYRGHAIPGLRGHYLYADYCTGNFGALRVEGGALLEQVDITTDLNPEGLISISSFGTDNAGELYVLTHSGAAFPAFVGGAGGLYRIDPE